MINFKTGTDTESAILEIEGSTLTVFTELCALVSAVCEKLAEAIEMPYEEVLSNLYIVTEKGAKNEKGNSSKGH